MGVPVKLMILCCEKVYSVKVLGSGYENVCYSYDHGIQCKQHKEHAFHVGQRLIVGVVECVLIVVMN